MKIQRQKRDETITIPNIEAGLAPDLFKHCGETLYIEQLQSVAGLDHLVGLEAYNIAETLGALATVMASSHNSDKPDDQRLSAILLGLSYRAKDIGILVDVIDDAKDLLNEKQKLQ